MMSRHYAVIGSSHLFGLIQRYVGPVDSGRYDAVWRTGVPAVAPLPLDTPGWQGHFVLYNTPAGGPPPVLKDGVLYLSPQLSEVFSHIPAEAEVIFSLMRGHEFAIASLVDDPGHADFIGDDGGFEPGRPWQSRGDALAWVREIAAPLLGTHLALRQHRPAARLVHIAAPPPIEDEAHIRAHAEGFGPLFEQHGIKPFAMRQRIYQLMYSELGNELARHGVLSLPAPANALTPSGGLRADMARGCLHGNQGYAELLAAQITEALSHVPPL